MSLSVVRSCYETSDTQNAATAFELMFGSTYVGRGQAVVLSTQAKFRASLNAAVGHSYPFRVL